MSSTGFRELWSIDYKSLGLDPLPDRDRPTVAITADVVVVTGAGGKTIGLDRSTGNVRWTVTLLPPPKDKVLDPPDDLASRVEPKDGYDEVVASGSGIALVLSFNWTVAIDPATGQVLWSQVGYWRSVGSYPDVFLTGTSQLHRVDPRSGATLWDATPPGYLLGENDTTVVNLQNARGDQLTKPRTVSGFDRNTGKTLWQRPDAVLPPVENGVIVEGERGFVVGEDGRVVALSTATGEQLWENADGEVRGRDGNVQTTDPRLLGARSGSVFIGVQAHGAAVLAIDGASGAFKWRADLPWERKPVGSVGSAGVLATTPEYFVLLNTSDGHVRASRGDLAGAATMVDRTMCAPTTSGGGGTLSLTCMEAS